ncbi:MAG: hypothetical protein M0C28_07820 [Candidatus Moduliflexus flocculans]|nr:hypothetical protein [Candidatus Moduliflexus flocculans]
MLRAGRPLRPRDRLTLAVSTIHRRRRRQLQGVRRVPAGEGAASSPQGRARGLPQEARSGAAAVRGAHHLGSAAGVQGAGPVPIGGHSSWSSTIWNHEGIPSLPRP